MWSEDIAKKLIKKGNKSEDELTRDLATYLGDALNTINYLKQQIEEITEENNEEN